MSSARKWDPIELLQHPYKLSTEDFQYFSFILEQKTGIHLSKQKKDLLQSRLAKYVFDKKYLSFSEYRQHLAKLPAAHPEWQDFINCLTTNKTDFFREENHFIFLQDHLRENYKNQSVNIWCAASSTGEEPYTLSYVLQSLCPSTIKDYHVLATDLDSDVLKKAQNAVYNKDSVSHLDPKIVRSIFDSGKNDMQNWLRVKSTYKNKISFQSYNLISTVLPKEQPFDMVFCRNVLFYFQSETVEIVVNKLYDCTKKNGLLFISHSESLQKIKSPWKHLQSSIYIKK